ncbi:MULTISPECIES: sensor histidine kinase [unclassified Kitasatospora]|uniref:sensor histidine kinase n=1 Tax=unclassified Kitasatospora TaxID=2633591 RepID=UPI002475566D|nr:sensor histidine kinase [Kitasatospora sp. MAP12-44]
MPETPLDHRPDESREEGRGRFAMQPGVPVENRRQLLIKLCWMTVWMIYLFYPVQDLLHGPYSTAQAVTGWLAMAAFLAGYLLLVVFRSMRGTVSRGTYPLVALLVVIATTTSFAFSPAWIVLFTYTSVVIGAVLPSGYAVRGVLATGVLTTVVALLTHTERAALPGLLLPAFLSGLAMTGLQRLVGTMRELREARETVAHLAAAEERLRMARDLHDLLGHSLSLITLKSELAGRFMDAEKSEAARAQVADIEQVARQSLIDVREAVSGFRRPTLPVELAAARTALDTVGVTLEAAPTAAEQLPGLGDAEAGALAWALREAVTNIVRHAEGATICTVAMDETWDGDGARFAVLDIADNGRGPGKSAPGNGLSGLDERLALVGGRLESGPGPLGRGFRLRALVPLGATAQEPLAERALSSGA